MEYTTRELSTEDAAALTKDLQAVLEKHDAEMSVVAQIHLLKRIKQEPLSSFLVDGDQTKSNTETEKSS